MRAMLPSSDFDYPRVDSITPFGFWPAPAKAQCDYHLYKRVSNNNNVSVALAGYTPNELFIFPLNKQKQ